MKAYIKERTMQVARYVQETHETVRHTAKVFNLSKSTVHNDLSKRLRKIDVSLYNKVQKILDFNFNEKHKRGGLSTQKKYKEKNNEK